MSDKPDEYTNAWWRQQMKGVLHIQNRLSALCDDAITDAAKQADRLEEFKRQWEEEKRILKAELGQLKEQIEQQGITIEKAREAFAKLQSKGD